MTPLPPRAGGAHAQVRLQNQSGPLEDSAEPPGAWLAQLTGNVDVKLDVCENFL